ncbi:hypothetical protein L1987_76319 [Smallanthus sonchifolius]|uniref:Uncharacterized protein n=1 Tax=Smallanthus sonchifolius TaxID=185202 RepID=A0ACB9A8I0_9ASTR|nr:hypothetical protein L1987_76319 [Smallanthus sonchifolius]
MKIPVLSSFMYDEPSMIWITVATLSTVYLGFAEIIGSHLQYSKFANSSEGIKLSSRAGMLILYTPALLAGIVSFFVFPGDGIRFILLKFAVTFHFFKRDFEVVDYAVNFEDAENILQIAIDKLRYSLFDVGSPIAVIECPDVSLNKYRIPALGCFPCVNIPSYAGDCQYQVTDYCYKLAFSLIQVLVGNIELDWPTS